MNIFEHLDLLLDVHINCLQQLIECKRNLITVQFEKEQLMSLLYSIQLEDIVKLRTSQIEFITRRLILIDRVALLEKREIYLKNYIKSLNFNIKNLERQISNIPKETHLVPIMEEEEEFYMKHTIASWENAYDNHILMTDIVEKFY